MINETLIPKVGVVTDVRKDTPDVKTFRVVGTDGKKLFQHMPGQCAMVSIPGVGECMFSITSSPTNEEYMEFSIKKCGCVTEVIHALEVGQQITVRGPYGKNFPVEEDFSRHRIRCKKQRRSCGYRRDSKRMDERAEYGGLSHHRPSSGRLGRTRWIRTCLRQRAWTRSEYDGSSLWTSHHDQVYAGRTFGTRI